MEGVVLLRTLKSAFCLYVKLVHEENDFSRLYTNLSHKRHFHMTYM